MDRRNLIIAAVLACVALLLPVQGLAALLVGADSPQLARVVTGVWIFKAMLLVHALVVLALGRFAPPRADAPLLALDLVDEPAKRWHRIALALLLVTAAALRLYDLGDGLWFDEIQTLVSYVRLPIGQIVATFDSQNQHMLYSVFARAAVALFGESAWALRLPAALLGVASLGALYWFGALVAGRREALLATALLAFSYHHVWFSQNARGYTGLVLWTLLGTGVFLRLITTREPRGWRLAAWYGAAMALALYTHATAIFIVAAHFLVWAGLAIRARVRGNQAAAVLPLVGFVLAGTFTLQLYALVLPQFLATLMEPTMEGLATSWKDPLWLISETLRVLAAGVPGGLVTVALAALVAVVGVLSFARRSITVMTLLLLPGLLTAAAMLSLQHNLWPRFFFFSAGFAVLIAVRGALALGSAVLADRGRLAATAVLVLVVAGSAFTVPTAYHPKQDYAGARELIRRERAAGDAVVTVDMSDFVYRKYLEPDWLGVSDAGQLAQIEGRSRRTWMVYTFGPRLAVVHPDIWARLQKRYTTAAEFPGTLGGGKVVVMVNR